MGANQTQKLWHSEGNHHETRTHQMGADSCKW